MLGEGGSGQTWLCRDMEKKKMVAIKFIKRAIPKIVLPMLMHEIKIQAELGDGHVNLVCCKAVVLTDTHLGIVMEYASGGNLTNYVTEKWDTSAERDGLFLSEDEARYFFRQYIEAVEFLHANRVAHRDLKLDNIVLDGSRPPRIKVCDFGFAKNWDEEANMFTQIGTPVYMSPQLISCKHNSVSYDATKADIWACGVLLFVMLLGMFPYDHTEHPDPNSSDAHIEVWMQQNRFSWRESPAVAESARKLSLECQDLLDKMFDRDEKRRISIERIKSHRWYKKPVPDELQVALDAIKLEQSQRASMLNGDHAVHPMNEKINRELEAMLEEAGSESPGPSSVPFKRIDLTRSAMLQAGTLSSASAASANPSAAVSVAAAVGASAVAGTTAAAAASVSDASHHSKARGSNSTNSNGVTAAAAAPTPDMAAANGLVDGGSAAAERGADGPVSGAPEVQPSDSRVNSDDVTLCINNKDIEPSSAKEQAHMSEVAAVQAVTTGAQ